MKIKFVGNAMIAKSFLKTEDILKAQRFCPEAMTLYKEIAGKLTPVCAVSVGEHGGINENGVVYNSSTDDGFAMVSGGCNNLDNTPAENVAGFTEAYADVILNINKTERQIFDALQEMSVAINEAMESVEIIEI